VKLWRLFWLSLAGSMIASATGCAQLAGLGGAAQPGAPVREGGRAVTVSVQPAREGPISLVLTYSGSVQPVSQVSIVPKVSGRVEKLAVDVGSSVKAGDLIARLDRATLEASVKQAEANLQVAQARLATIQTGSRPEEIAQAEATLASAKARLAQVKNGPTAADLQAAESAVTTAQSALQKAQTDLLKLKQMPTDDDLRAAQLDLDKANNALYAAQAARDGVCVPRNPKYQCDSAQASVAAAETAVAQAQRAYDRIRAGAKPEDIGVAEKAVASAQAQLQSAQAKLAQLKASPTPEDIAIATAAVTQAESALALKKNPYTDRDLQSAQAQVAQAQAALDSAKAQLAEADVVAPFDGIVTQKLLSEGAIASAQSPLVVLASQAVEVAVTAEEARIGLIQPGLSTTLTVPAYPGQAIPARVSSVAPGADAKTHTFVVKVTPNDQDGRLKPGMFAEVKVTAQEQPKAVLVPKEGVFDRSGKSYVFVVADNKAALREIKTGLSDDQQVEAVSGVKPGEMVVVAGQASLSDGDAIRIAGAQPGQAPARPGGQQGQSGQSGQQGQGAQQPRPKPEGASTQPTTGGPTEQPAAGTPAPKQ